MIAKINKEAADEIMNQLILRNLSGIIVVDFINIKDNEDKIGIKCKKHKDKNVEYYCFQCGEHLCPKCLLYFNQSVVEKHKGHTIASISDLKNYNIKEAIEEYNKLKNSKIELD